MVLAFLNARLARSHQIINDLASPKIRSLTEVTELAPMRSIGLGPRIRRCAGRAHQCYSAYSNRKHLARKGAVGEHPMRRRSFVAALPLAAIGSSALAQTASPLAKCVDEPASDTAPPPGFQASDAVRFERPDVH